MNIYDPKRKVNPVTPFSVPPLALPQQPLGLDLQPMPVQEMQMQAPQLQPMEPSPFAGLANMGTQRMMGMLTKKKGDDDEQGITHEAGHASAAPSIAAPSLLQLLKPKFVK